MTLPEGRELRRVARYVANNRPAVSRWARRAGVTVVIFGTGFMTGVLAGRTLDTSVTIGWVYCVLALVAYAIKRAREPRTPRSSLAQRIARRLRGRGSR